jgi:hypothetical protein
MVEEMSRNSAALLVGATKSKHVISVDGSDEAMVHRVAGLTAVGVIAEASRYHLLLRIARSTAQA